MEEIITIQIVWTRDDEVIHEFTCCEMTFPTIEWAEAMILDQFASLDYILRPFAENEQVSACIVIEELEQFEEPQYTEEEYEQDNKTYLVLVYIGIYPFKVEVESDWDFGDVFVFTHLKEAEDFILSRNVGDPQHQISWGIVEFDPSLVPPNKHLMVYKPEIVEEYEIKWDRGTLSK